MRGYFAVGIENGKFKVNVGTLWRSANIFGAAFIFTIGKRYDGQASDTMKSWKHIPLLHFDTLADFGRHIPRGASIVGIEMHPLATTLAEHEHPERAVYLLGSEDVGLSQEAVDLCDSLIQLPGERSMNVSVAGSIAMYDRITRKTS